MGDKVEQKGKGETKDNVSKDSGKEKENPAKGDKKDMPQAPTIKKAPKVSHKEFDLDQYISNYTGHSRITRLIFIGERWEEGGLKAFKMAVDELKKTMNTSIYKDLYDVYKVGELLGAGYQKDQEWIDSVDKKTHQQIERLEIELNQYKTHLVKESIRVAYNDLGDAHYEKGDLNSALKCFVRTRDYCATSKHILVMCLNVIRVSIEMGNFSHVINYVNKAEQTPDMNDKVVSGKIKCSAGLAHLENRKYKVAARKFLETDFELGNNFTDVLSSRDVAIYGGLCALATFDRQELKRKVLDNQVFKNFLELVPQVRGLLNDFYGSRYASCLNYLEQLKNDLLLDLHLHDHVSSLYQQIRNKALIQYFSPFVSVDLGTMAKAFNTDVSGLEKELSALILEGSIQARIDSHNKVLYAKAINQRSSTFDKSIKMGDYYQRNTKAMLLRVNLMKHDFVVRPANRREKDDRKGRGSTDS